jgi:hypothetical protein
MQEESLLQSSMGLSAAGLVTWVGGTPPTHTPGSPPLICEHANPAASWVPWFVHALKCCLGPCPCSSRPS